MATVKQIFKRNSHNLFFQVLAGFGRSLNRLYENRNHDIFSNGEYNVLQKIAMFNPSVIIDGGANIGNYSILASRLTKGCRIFAFEPVVNTYTELKENTDGYDDITAVNKGLYKEHCKKEINIYKSHTHSSLYDIQGLTKTSDKKTTVELIKGDAFLEEQKLEKVDLLKLDVEGSEFDAIQGFDRSISHGTIKAIQFEYGYINISTKNLLIDFYNYFEKRGYLLGKIFPKKVEFRKYAFKYEDFLGPNFIAVKETEMELINVLKNKINGSRLKKRKQY